MLRALFIGINNIPSLPLRGCINDVVAFSNLLKTICDKQNPPIAFQPRYLLAPHAEEVAVMESSLGITSGDYLSPTRQNILDAFSHFDNAGTEDICLLYYSGHGSRVPVSQAFWHLCPDRMMETLVCVDSRDAGGKDLLDQELAQKIWKIKGNPHILAIMDCCYAGGNTRDARVLTRHAEPMTDWVVKDADLEGFPLNGQAPSPDSFYYTTVDGRMNMRHGRHVQMAAARSTEKAKELLLDGAQHGVFTWALMKTLNEGGAALSYRELLQRVRLRVVAQVSDQLPLLDAREPEDELLGFLGKPLQGPAERYLIHRRDVAGRPEWVLDAGAINGILPSSAAHGDTLLRLEDGRLVKVFNVRPQESILDFVAFTDEENARPDLTFKAEIAQMAAPKLQVAWGASLLSEQGQVLLKKMQAALQDAEFHYFEMVNGEAPYAMETDGQAYVLKQKGSEMPLFQRSSEPEVFLDRLSKVGRWQSIRGLANPAARIQRNDVSVEIEIIEGQSFGGNPDAVRATAPMLMDPGIVQLQYKKVNNQPQQPAFRCKIKAVKGAYYIGALLLGSKYGVEELLKPTEITTDGVGAYLGFTAQGRTFITIPLQLDPIYLKWGIREVKDYLKIFISHKPFNLSSFVQEGLKLDDTGGVKRSSWGGPLQPAPDWMTIDIPLVIGSGE